MTPNPEVPQPAECYVLKINRAGFELPLWVMPSHGAARSLGPRISAREFPDRSLAEKIAGEWRHYLPHGFTVAIEQVLPGSASVDADCLMSTPLQEEWTRLQLELCQDAERLSVRATTEAVRHRIREDLQIMLQPPVPTDDRLLAERRAVFDQFRKHWRISVMNNRIKDEQTPG